MSLLGGLLGGQPPLLRLQGERLHLRPPERADWPAWTELRAQSREFLKPWEPSWTADALSRAAFRRRLARYALDWREDVGYSFLIFLNEGEALLGGIGLTNVRRGVAETATLGYWIGRPHARLGYMTEAIGLALAYAFERLKLHRIEAACLPANRPSRDLLIKSGFVEEGYARQYLCIDGRWQDHVLHALLAEDWARSRI
jgi:ribosomal-protein-alanine N-acetyltransferase